MSAAAEDFRGFQLSPFDWRQIVTQNKPGTDSADQQWRQAALPRFFEDLQKWAAQYQLSHKRMQVSAYTGIVNTLPPGLSKDPAFSYHMASLISRATLWLFDLDDFIDFYIQRQSTAGELSPNWLHNLELQLSYILGPLFDLAATGREPALPVDHEPPLNLTVDEAQVEPTSVGLRNALHDIYQEVQTLAPTQEAADFRTINFAAQAARLLQSMRWDLFISQEFGRNPANLPTPELYLSTAGVSIGLPFVAGVVIGLEETALQTWKASYEVMEHAAKIARLVNDIGSFWQELEEHKVNSMTEALVQLGAPPLGPYQLDSPEVAQARELVSLSVQKEVEAFERGLATLAETPYTYWLRNTVAFALIMYEKGNYVEPE